MSWERISHTAQNSQMGPINWPMADKELPNPQTLPPGHSYWQTSLPFMRNHSLRFPWQLYWLYWLSHLSIHGLFSFWWHSLLFWLYTRLSSANKKKRTWSSIDSSSSMKSWYTVNISLWVCACWSLSLIVLLESWDGYKLSPYDLCFALCLFVLTWNWSSVMAITLH